MSSDDNGETADSNQTRGCIDGLAVFTTVLTTINELESHRRTQQYWRFAVPDSSWINY